MTFRTPLIYLIFDVLNCEFLMPAVHSPREPETMREQECWWNSCSLQRSYLALLAIAFLAVHDVRVKGCRASLGCRLVSQAKFKYNLRHILVFVFVSFFFSIRIPCQEFGKRDSPALIHLERCVKKSKILITQYIGHWKFSLSYVRPRLALAPRGLRARGKSVKSRTRTVSSCITLTWESRQTHSARVYCRH